MYVLIRHFLLNPAKLPNEEEKVLGDDQSDFMTALTFHVGHLHLSQLFMVS